MSMKELQTSIEQFRDEVERLPMIQSMVVMERLDKWIGTLKEELDDNKAKFEQLLIDKRKEYTDTTGTKPFMGWGLAMVDRKLEERKNNNRLIKEYAEALPSKSHKWKIAKKALKV